MLMINADDWGRNTLATDSTFQCYLNGRISSASAMVFMQDSERSAQLAKGCGINLGLHLNFTEEFTANSVPAEIRHNHQRIRTFLLSSKYTMLIYNPFLRGAFKSVCEAQVQEYVRLYGRPPSRMDGHQHMHLCTNSLVDRLLPAGIQVRRNFSFCTGEKSALNRHYRKLVDTRLARRHRLTDYFFALPQNWNGNRLNRVFELSKTSQVELMTHPEIEAEYEYLMSDGFSCLIGSAAFASSGAGALARN